MAGSSALLSGIVASLRGGIVEAIAGGVSGGITILAVQPIETVQIFQAAGEPSGRSPVTRRHSHAAPVQSSMDNHDGNIRAAHKGLHRLWLRAGNMPADKQPTMLQAALYLGWAGLLPQGGGGEPPWPGDSIGFRHTSH
jgi:hypothetical protein